MTNFEMHVGAQLYWIDMMAMLCISMKRMKDKYVPKRFLFYLCSICF